MQFHTLVNSIPTGNRPNGHPVSTVEIGDDGSVNIRTNYRFSDIDDVSSGGPLIKAWVTNRMKAEKEGQAGDGTGTYAYYDKEFGDDKQQVGTTHDIEIEINLKPPGQNKSTWRKKNNQSALNLNNLSLKEAVVYDTKKLPPKSKELEFVNPKDIKPELPPDKSYKAQKHGWHPDSPNMPKDPEEEKELDRLLKVTAQDVIRQYRLSKKQIEEFHKTVDEINKFIKANPKQAEEISRRYPYDDPRLAELNWKLDQRLEASDKYIDMKFPENKKVTGRIKKILSKTIEMTDPKSFKMDPTPPSQLDYDKLKLRETASRHFKKPVQLKSWHKGHLTDA
jgi:hypothetical protein